MRPNPGQIYPRRSRVCGTREVFDLGYFQCWWPGASRRFTRIRTTQDRSIRTSIRPLRASKLTRFVTAIQLVGSLLAVPIGIASAYSFYRANFSPDTTCQNLRSGIVAMLDKSVDAATRRILVRRDVEAFEKACGTVDPDATAAFKTLLNVREGGGSAGRRGGDQPHPRCSTSKRRPKSRLARSSRVRKRLQNNRRQVLQLLKPNQRVAIRRYRMRSGSTRSVRRLSRTSRRRAIRCPRRRRARPSR